MAPPQAKKFLYMFSDKTMNYVLRVAGGYGIVQVSRGWGGGK
jgi:hypothetical protein